MNWEQYRQDVFRTVRPDLDEEGRLLSGALGLCGEAGEVAEQLKKHFFHGHPLDRAKLSNELGDVLWYWVLLCDTLGLSMESVVAGNVEKLRRRYPEGFSTEHSINRVEEAE
jgi:NTP pyrophosphatase (non-canonical NTP hydrolase)